MSRRGFAGMSGATVRKIAARGGAALRPEQRAYSQNRELARESGRKGGRMVPPESRSFSRDPELAREAGRKGGRASRRGKAKESSDGLG